MKYFITLTIFLVILFIYFISNPGSKFPKPLPPINEPNAKYFIQKRDNIYLIEYDSDNEKQNNQYNYRIAIGNSQVELANLVGKQVEITGNYRRDDGGLIILTNTQCVLNICHQIYDKTFFGEERKGVVIDITNVKEVR